MLSLHGTRHVRTSSRAESMALQNGTAIIEAGAGDTDREEEPSRIHQHMTLPALDLLATVIAACARLSRGEERCHQRPLLVRHIGWIYLSRLIFLQHCHALLC